MLLLDKLEPQEQLQNEALVGQELFIKDFCFMSQWCEKLKPYDYRGLLEAYLVPKHFINVPNNAVAFFYALMLSVKRRSCKRYKKIFYYAEDKEKEVYHLFFLFNEYFRWVSFKKDILKKMEAMGAPTGYNELSFILLSILGDTYLKLKNGALEKELEAFRKNLDLFLNAWGLVVKPIERKKILRDFVIVLDDELNDDEVKK